MRINIQAININYSLLNQYYKVAKERESYSQFAFLQKRVIDFSFSVLLLIITSPIMLYAIYRIKKESPGSILFKQSRVGLNGENFTCIKFRSMHENMEFNPYTEDDDPRIFPFGRLMRKMRIDELPQVWNVLKGDMHLIGPRAEWDILVNEYKKVIPKYQKRHLVKPGITGLAQVLYPYGRNINDARNKLRYDLKYIESWSFGLELKILWKTVMVVLGRRGV
jgi:lipopolysaccharide/colanic/teichoic acid biosynthesis glycosyltransferase